MQTPPHAEPGPLGDAPQGPQSPLTHREPVALLPQGTHPCAVTRDPHGPFFLMGDLAKKKMGNFKIFLNPVFSEVCTMTVVQGIGSALLIKQNPQVAFPLVFYAEVVVTPSAEEVACGPGCS